MTEQLKALKRWLGDWVLWQGMDDSCFAIPPNMNTSDWGGGFISPERAIQDDLHIQSFDCFE